MLLRIAKSVAAALLFYILYYVCHIAAAFVLPISDSIILTVIGSAIFTAASVCILLVMKKKPRHELCLTKLPVGECLLVILLGVAFNICCTVIMALIPFPKELVESYAKASAELTNTHIVWSAVLTLIIAPTVEELLYRGLFYGNLKKAMHPIIAGLISGLLFGLAHSSPIWIIYASFFGFVLAFVFEKYRSITASVLFHFGFNLFGFLSGEINIPGTVIIDLFIPCLVYAAFMIAHIIDRSKKSQTKDKFTI